jgi:hypothetical protein
MGMLSIMEKRDAVSEEVDPSFVMQIPYGYFFDYWNICKLSVSYL